MIKATTVAKLGLVGLLGFAAALPAATGTEKTASAGDKPEIAGSWEIIGKGDDGSKYTGSATITKIGGDMYKGKWTIGSTTFHQVCFRDDDSFSCGWAEKEGKAHVVAYLVNHADYSWDGVWFGPGDTKLGKEVITPKGKVDKKTLSGNYSITKGENPDGSKYSGSVKIAHTPDIDEEAYDVIWQIGSTKIDGVGIRNHDGDDDDIVGVGFTDDPKAGFGALVYAIQGNGKTMKGPWVQEIKGSVTSGDETMKKK
jgi:hypothetical protein